MIIAGRFFFDLRSVGVLSLQWWLFCLAAVWWFAYGVGLSLLSYRSIRFAPVRGGTYFLCRRKESRQRKRAATASR
jgi:hypothetical protein